MQKKQTTDRRVALKNNRVGWKQTTTFWVEYLSNLGIQNAHISGKYRVSFCCPFHQDKNPSAHIYLDSLKFRCFAATCDTLILDVIVFISRTSNISYVEAVELFKKVAPHTDFLKSDNIKYLSEVYVNERRMQMIADVFHDYLLDIWNRSDIPESTKAARDWLKNVREIDDPASITSLGLFPRFSDFKLKFKGTLDDLDWALKFLGSFLDNKYVDRVVFTFASTPSHITAFKLRAANAEHQEVIVRRDGEPLGFFGLINPGYKHLIHNEEFRTAFVVEGEFDQLAFYKNQLKTGVFNEVVLGLCGNGHNGLNELEDSGFSKANVIGDDDAGGLSFTKGVLEKTSSLALRLFIWSEKLRIENVKLDPDEAVKQHGFSKMYSYFSNEKNYKYPPRWCKDLVDEDLRSVDTEDVKAQEEVVIKHGALLKDETELRTFCDLITKDYPLLTSSGIFKNIRKTNDSDIGFIHNIASWVRRKLLVLYMDHATNELFLWHRTKRIIVRVNLRSKQTAYSSFFQQVQGVTIFEWARDEVGLPSYYPPVDVVPSDDPDKMERPGTKFVRNQIESCLYEAFGLLAGEASPRPGVFFSQGIHLEDIDLAGTPGYIVVGDRIYKLIYHEDGENLLEVNELDGPVDGRTVFDLERRDQIATDKSGSWLPCIRETSDFFKKPKYSLRECYELVHEIFNSVSEFKFQANDIQYATLLIFYSYLSDAMQRRVMTHLHGEFESGKSSLLSLIAGNQQLWDYRLSYHAVSLDNYTIAGVFQGFCGTKFLIGLDEANDSGEENNNKIRKLLESFRGLATKGVADRTLGSVGQHVRYQSLYNPVITASATEIHDDMDYSRFRKLSLVKNSNKANTRVVLTKRYGVALFEELRTSIFLNIIRVAPKIARIYKELPVEFSSGTKHKLDRIVDGLLPLAAIAKYLGLDYISFITGFCTNREPDEELRKVARDGQSILDKILNIPKVQIMMPGTDKTREMSLRTALRTVVTREAINDSECGVYYDEKEKAIGIAWEQARIALLHHDRSLRSTAKMLKGTASTCEFWINEMRARQSGLQQRLMAKGLAAATIYSFFDVSSYIKVIENSISAMEPGLSDDKQVNVDVNKVEDKDAMGGMNL